MGGEYHLQVKQSAAGKFSISDQRKWEAACAVLQDLARLHGLRVATKPEEEDHGYDKRTTTCKTCSNRKCAKVFLVWHPHHWYWGGIEVPLTLNVAPYACGFGHSPPSFYVLGCDRWPTSSSCDEVKAVLGYLFPGKFEVETKIDCAIITHDVFELDGSELDLYFPSQFAARLQSIKSGNPSLAELCQSQVTAELNDQGFKEAQH